MEHNAVSDLLAVATVRRLLLELGHELLPEPSDMMIGPLALWIHQPREEWGALTPMQALKLPDGEQRLRTCLVALMRSSSSSGTG